MLQTRSLEIGCNNTDKTIHEGSATERKVEDGWGGSADVGRGGGYCCVEVGGWRREWCTATVESESLPEVGKWPENC